MYIYIYIYSSQEANTTLLKKNSTCYLLQFYCRYSSNTHAQAQL